MAPSVMPQPTTATAPFLEFRNVGQVFQTRRGPFEALRDITDQSNSQLAIHNAGFPGSISYKNS